jgi:hypothetical protein
MIPTVGGQHGPSKMRGEDGPVAAIFFEAWDVDREYKEGHCDLVRTNTCLYDYVRYFYGRLAESQLLE